jgi:hypothetical protein
VAANPQNPKIGEGAGPVVQPHALLLDISQGKPLWDEPRGKIIRVDPDTRKVYVNLGTNHGVKKFLTFNVFAPTDTGRPSGLMRGTIEILSVIDGNTSLATITSLYDSRGNPIPLFDPNKGALFRAGDNPMKDGDLLFNPVWKAHVAIAGKFRFFDHNAVSATEEMRQLKQLIILLEKHDIIVDSYLDLLDGEIKGEVTPATQFLILGQPAVEEKQKLGAPAQTTDPKIINDKMKEMTDTAIAKGMFVISARNFANLIGYRPTHSAIEPVVSEFHPSVPAAKTQPAVQPNGK